MIDGVDAHYRAFGLRIGLRDVCVGVILVSSPDVQCCQRDLQRDKCISVVVPGPYDPQHVAEQEAPEADLASALCLGGNQPRGDHGSEHRRPLEPIQIIHGATRLRRRMRVKVLPSRDGCKCGLPISWTWVLASRTAHLAAWPAIC